MAEGSNNLTTYYAKRIIGDNAAASPDKALLQTGTTITSDEWILNQTARYNESPSKKYGILYNYDNDGHGHDVIEFWGNKPDTNNNNNPIPSVSITLDSGNTEIMGTLDVVESTLLQSTLTVNNTSLFKNTVTIQMASPTLVLDSTASGAVDWTIKNNQGIFTIDNNNNNSLTQILGNSTKGWQIDERLYINATIPDSPNYTLYVSGKTYVSGVSYLNGQVGIGYNPETSGNTHKLYVDGTTYLTDHLYIGRTNSSHIYLINKNWTKGTNPSSQTYSAIEYGSNDSTNNRVALLEATLDTSGNSQFNIFLVPNIANSTSWSGIVLKKTNEDILTIYNQGNTEVNGRVWIQAGSAAGSNVNRLETTAGMPGDMQYNQSRRGTQIYANGIAFADPYNGNSNNDAGWIRQIETTASSGYLEIATGDDGNEPIYVRQYKTDNTIARTFTLLDGSGNSSIPGHVDMPNETSIKFKIARKKADGGGWAYNPIQIRGNDDAIFSRWGVYGSGNNLSYIFFGVGDYNTTTHIRIDSSGHLVIPNDGIYYQGTKEKYRMIRFIDNTVDTYGNGISIGGGGLSIFGSGESADTMVANLGYTGGSEVTVIASDGSILFYPGNNSYDASAKIEMTAGRIWAGVNGNTTRENDIGVQSGAGQLYLWSAAATNGDRGLYLPAHGTGGAFAILRANTNNSVTILGNDVWGSSVRLVDNWIGFYNARQGGTRYGYIQANADRMYFRKENGVSTYHFDFNGHIYTPNNIYAHGIWANQTDGEKQVGVDNGTAGNLYLWSNNSGKGLYSGSGYQTGYVIRVTSSGKTFYGNATTATTLQTARTIWGQSFNGSANITGNFTTSGDGIYYTGSKATYRMIRFLNNTGDTYGNGVSVGGGGATIIGGGESADAAVGQVGAGSEIMYICNDGDVHIFTNMQNGWGSRKEFRFSSGGDMFVPGNLHAYLFQGSSGSHGYLVAGSNNHCLAVQTDCNMVLYRGGTSGSVAWTSNTGSSYLMKDNIRNIYKEELQNFDKLRVVNFTYKKELHMEDNRPQFGLIAEEVISLYPYVVNVPPDYNPANFNINKKLQQPFLSIKYERFVPLLIKKIQLQEEEISELRAQLNAIKNQINNL